MTVFRHYVTVQSIDAGAKPARRPDRDSEKLRKVDQLMPRMRRCALADRIGVDEPASTRTYRNW
jgi:hypothetical protein